MLVKDHNSFAKEKLEAEGLIRFRKIQNANFLSSMESILPWKSIVSLIESEYLYSKLSLSLIKVETMLRIYFVQLWFKLSDTEVEATLFDCESVRSFTQLKQGRDLIPRKAEIKSFRQLVKQQGLEEGFNQTVLLNIIHQPRSHCS